MTGNKRTDFKVMRDEQIRLSGKIRLKDGFSRMNLIAGADFFYKDDKAAAAIVICKVPGFEIVDRSVGIAELSVPFKDGFLAYRIMPAIIKAYERLKSNFDVMLVNGRGIDHARKLGLASHLGLMIDKPTVGVSKNHYGFIDKGKIYIKKEIVGFEVLTRNYANPLYISPGNKISLGSALESVKISIKPPHKLPEPMTIAHRIAKKHF